jgi:CheY-like chemotaxis protein
MNIGTTAKAHTFRILIVDDDPEGHTYFEPHVAAAWGNLHTIEIEQARSPEDALNRLSTSSYAVVLVSWKNTAFAGAAFLRNMRGYGMRTPVVVVSSLLRGDIRDNIESFGAVLLNRGMMGGIALRDAVASSIRLVNTSQASTDGVSRRFPFKSKPPRAQPPV